MSEILPADDLDIQLHETFFELGITPDQKLAALALVRPLKERDSVHREHYEHSVRVALLARRIGSFMHLDEKALFFAGLFHDLGKQEIDIDLLGKTGPWTEGDKQRIQEHVMVGYNILKGKFDFSAEIILFHHRFQTNGYPQELPPFLHDYSEGTKVVIKEYARLLALADVYDALHRENSQFGEKRRLSDVEIEEQMVEHNPDRRELVEDLYRAEIFINAEKARETEAQKRLYEGIWGEVDKRTPRETGRQVMLAAALEPISDKNGNTTRYGNMSRFLKLEYFVAGGINLGESFEEMARRIDIARGQPLLLYDLALKAQKDSLKNRSGGRVNQGIIEILLPLVASQHIYNSDYSLSVDEILNKAVEVLGNTSKEDIEYLRHMKRFAFDLSSYTDRTVPEHPEAATVLDYYQRDLISSSNPTSIAHNRELVKGFPTVRLIYENLSNPRIDRFSHSIEDAYRKALSIHDPDVGRGFIADCIAAGIYLYLSQNPRSKLVS
jgi:putative nucleotidyltransferase with HDIG domain